jgi:hypothetical protein
MPKREHSPEPWTKHGKGTYSKPTFVKDANGEEVWHEETDRNFFPADEDTDRIIACINFCRDFPTEFLEEHQLLHPTEDDEEIIPVPNITLQVCKNRSDCPA